MAVRLVCLASRNNVYCGVLANVAAAELIVQLPEVAWSQSVVAGVAAAVPVARCVGHDCQRAEAAVPDTVKSR